MYDILIENIIKGTLIGGLFLFPIFLGLLKFDSE